MPRESRRRRIRSPTVSVVTVASSLVNTRSVNSSFGNKLTAPVQSKHFVVSSAAKRYLKGGSGCGRQQSCGCWCCSPRWRRSWRVPISSIPTETEDGGGGESSTAAPFISVEGLVDELVGELVVLAANRAIGHPADAAGRPRGVERQLPKGRVLHPVLAAHLLHDELRVGHDLD